MLRVLLVAVGGAIGSLLRYVISGVAQNLFRYSTFPSGTLVVNLLGCLLIGVASQLAEARGAFNDLSRALLFVGILGGFTTFSTFGNETFSLFRSGSNSLGLTNIGLQVLGGLSCVWIGRSIAYVIWR